MLNQISSLTNLPHEKVVDFLSIGQEKQIAKKTKLTKPNLYVDKAYFLKNGIVRHFIKKGDQEFTKSFLKGPKFILPSLTNFFLETKSYIYCEAMSELEVIEWTRDELYEFADNNPKMYKFLLKSVVKAFEGKEQKEIALNQLEAKDRYLNFLNDFPNLINEIPNQYVATYLGVRPETLSRIRSKLNS